MAKTKKSSKLALKKAKSKKATSKNTKLKKNVVTKKPTRKKVKKKASFKNKINIDYKDEEAFLASIKPYKLSKKEKYMNLKQRNHFDQILLTWKLILQQEQEKTVVKIQDVSSSYADESDRATHEEGFALEIRTRERERRLLYKIEQSLKKIKSKDYGYCVNPHCGVEIGIRRLEARPTANLCIDCKTLEEIKEKQNFG